MPQHNSVMNAIAAALDTGLDDEYLIGHVVSRVRPDPWTLAEERFRP
jgi:hypothetical protein